MPVPSPPYPASPSARNHWILEQRGPKNTLDAWRPYAFLREDEVGSEGIPVPTATLFLTNKECPYRCLMCDLWQNTLDTRVPVGAIPAQIHLALKQLEKQPAPQQIRQIKLYNAGSFFDPQAIPPEDYPEIARLVNTAGIQRTIVECHPALIGPRILPFRDLLDGTLEVAIGLETAHPTVLERLNKRITVDSFRRASAFLVQNRILLRVFLLLRPPFLSETEGLEWTQQSLDVAFDAGASVCCVIPTRGGNGAMEALAAAGDFTPPGLPSLEAALEYGLRLQRGRVFADLWDIEKLFACPCAPARAARLEEMNRTQQIPTPVACPLCNT